MAADSDGHLYQWGSSWSAPAHLPVQVSQGDLPFGAPIVQLSCGGNFAVAVTDTGDAYAWGSNNFGQLGDGTTTDRTAPVRVSQGERPAGVTFQKVYAGSLLPSGMTALGSDARVYSWGTTAPVSSATARTHSRRFRSLWHRGRFLRE